MNRCFKSCSGYLNVFLKKLPIQGNSNTYHDEYFLFCCHTNRQPAVCCPATADLQLLGSTAAMARSQLAILNVGANSRVPHPRTRATGWLGPLRAFPSHSNLHLGSTGIRKRRLQVGHWLGGWRHTGYGADGQRQGRRHRDGWAVVIQGVRVVFYKSRGSKNHWFIKCSTCIDDHKQTPYCM